MQSLSPPLSPPLSPRPHVERRGSGTPLILLHGNAVDHRLLLPLERAFQGADGWRRVYVDLPGFGRTPALPGRGGLPELADWVARFLADETAGRPFAVLGSSLGGLLARDLVAANADKALGLALLCPVVDPVHARRRLPDQTLLVRDDTLLDGLETADRDEYESTAVIQSRENWRGFRDHVLPGLRAADPDAIRRLAAAYDLGRTPERAGTTFERPTVIVTGRQDHIVGYEDQTALLNHYPRASYAVVDGAGHNAHLDQPTTVHALIRDWLGRLARGG